MPVVTALNVNLPAVGDLGWGETVNEAITLLADLLSNLVSDPLSQTAALVNAALADPNSAASIALKVLTDASGASATASANSATAAATSAGQAATSAANAAAIAAALPATTDPLVANLLNDDLSVSRIAINQIVSLFTRAVFTEDREQPGDVSRSESWQRTVAWVIGQGGHYRIMSRRPTVEFHTAVNIKGLKFSTFESPGTHSTVIRSKNANLVNAFTCPTFASSGVEGGIVDSVGWYRIDWEGGELVEPVETFVTGGDSFMAPSATYGQWQTTLGSLTTMPFLDHSVAGQSSTEIACRMGGVNPTFTIAGNSIPGSATSTTVTLGLPTSSWGNSGGAQSFTGNLTTTSATNVVSVNAFTLVIHGENSPVTYELIRTTAGSALDTTNGISFHCTESDSDRKTMPIIISAGRNNISDPAIVVRDVKSIIDYKKGQGFKNFIVNSQFNRTTEMSTATGASLTNYNSVMAINAALALNFPKYYCDVRSYMVVNGTADAGLATDSAALAGDTVATSLRANADTLHLNVAGRASYGKFMASILIARNLVKRFARYCVQNGDDMTAVGATGDAVRYYSRSFGGVCMTTPIRLDGNRQPGESKNAVVRNIVMKDCKIVGTVTLPVLFRGVSNVRLQGNWIERTMDAGFTYCDGVTVHDNDFQWGADNGFSVSRGTSNIQVTNNRIYGSWFAGIWTAGYQVPISTSPTVWAPPEFGPRHGVVKGNIIRHIGAIGIEADHGVSYLTIEGNDISDVYRGIGPRESDDLGYGILLTGNYDQGVFPPVYSELSTGCQIIGNTVEDTHGFGIIWAGVSDLLVTNNVVKDIGLPFHVSGVVTTNTDVTQNIALGSMKAPGKWLASSCSNVLTVNNTYDDTRTPPYANWGVQGANEAASNWNDHINRVSNVSNQYIDNATTRTTGNAAARVVQPNAATADAARLVWSTDLSGNWEMRRVATTKGHRFTNIGQGVDVWNINYSDNIIRLNNAIVIGSGSTAQRPAYAANLGGVFFDTTLGRHVFARAAGWIDYGPGTVV